MHLKNLTDITCRYFIDYFGKRRCQVFSNQVAILVTYQRELHSNWWKKAVEEIQSSPKYGFQSALTNTNKENYTLYTYNGRAIRQTAVNMIFIFWINITRGKLRRVFEMESQNFQHVIEAFNAQFAEEAIEFLSSTFAVVLELHFPQTRETPVNIHCQLFIIEF